jgi:V/A-type H+/Na+-transporting ATPase subunit E
MPRIIGSGLESYLHRQARERALNRTAEAQEQARQMLEQAHAEAEALKQQWEAQTARSVEERRRRALAQGRLRSKQTFWRRQEELMQHVWQQAEEALRVSTPDQRLATLIRLLDDAARQLNGGPLEVQTNAADRALLDEVRLQDQFQQLRETRGVTQLALAAEPAPIMGGVIVRRLDANQLVDNSYDERLALAQQSLRNQVYHLLTS